MNRFSKIRYDSGFTLIELLIAIAVSGIVLAGLVQVFSTTNSSYTKQDEMATLQQNLRTAKMTLDRDIRMAGSGFGTEFYYLGTLLSPLEFTNGGGSNGSDTLTIRYVNYDDNCYGVLPQLTVTNNLPPLGVTPPFTVEGDLSSWKPTAATTTCNTEFPFLAVYTRTPPLPTAAPYIGADVTNLISDVFMVTNINTPILECNDDWRTVFQQRQNVDLARFQPADVLQNRNVPRIGSINKINFFSATQLVTITYSLSPDRVLIRNEQPANIVGAIAEGIEDLQFAFWIDTNGDGVVDNTEWVNNQNLIDSRTYQIRLVRVSILGRSSRPLSGQKEITWPTKPLIEDHDVGTDSKYLRQLLQFEFKPRNLK